jgi:hypothetical protein
MNFGGTSKRLAETEGAVKGGRVGSPPRKPSSSKFPYATVKFVTLSP